MKKDKIFILTFLLILFGVLAIYPINFLLIKMGKKTLVMTDNWQIYEPIKENNIIDKLDNFIGSKKVSLENRTTNYFPFYLNINKLYESFNFNTNSLFYNNIPLKKDSGDELLFYNKKENFYYLKMPYTKEELDKRLENQIAFFNELGKKNIDLSIYIPTRYDLTNFSDDNLSSYVTRFKNGLDKNIKVKSMDLKDINEYKDYFYLTDHHWNIKGALKAYEEIMPMLEKEALDNLTIKEYKDLKYYGSMAKTALSSKTYDHLMDVNETFHYDAYINGNKAPLKFKPRTLNVRSNNQFFDYYIDYFNGQYDEVMYDYHNEDAENLLIIGDSYVWQIDHIIASSFNKTYVVNLRYGKWLNNNLIIEDYIKEHDISKVLVLYQGGSTLFDQYNYNLKDRVI